LAKLFAEIAESKDQAKLASEYFRFRISDPKRYQLFDRLEHKVIQDQAVPELVNQLHTIRASNLNTLTNIVESRIAIGALEDVPAQYHIAEAWALAHGSVASIESPF